MPPASILFPGLDGKASPTRDFLPPPHHSAGSPILPYLWAMLSGVWGQGAQRPRQVAECPGVALKAVSATPHPRRARRCR